MSEKGINRIKWGSGILLLLFVIFYGRNLYQQNQTLALFLMIGIGLGYIESRSEVGISSGYVDFFVTGSRSRLYGLLLLFGLGALGALFIHSRAAADGAVPQYLASSSQTSIPGTSAVTPVNFGLILGAFLFGVGLTISKGCGLGTLRNIGLGNGRYLLTLLFLLIGTIPGQWVKYHLDQSSLHRYAVQLYFPERIGYSGTALLIGLFLVLLVVSAIRYEKKRKKEGTAKEVKDANLPEVDAQERDRPAIYYFFKENWTRLTSVLLITVLLLLALGIAGEKLAVTKPLLYPAVELFQKLGVNFNEQVFSEPLQVVNKGVLNNNVIRQNIGIIFGAAIFALTSTSFSFSWDINLRESGWFMLGGFLMGFGAVLASGCIVGALYSGIVNFSLSGWVVFVFMSLGIWSTVKVMNGKISTIPNIER